MTSTEVSSLPRGEGRLPVEGGRIWYRVWGAGSGTPVILLHGGPGIASFYLKTLEALGDDRPVVRYDQLGAGKSDVVTDTTLFTIPRFVRELDSLRAALRYDQVHIVGHSWGTILAVEYYRAHPHRVVSLTLGSPSLDLPAWARTARRLLATLPESLQQAVAVSEKTGKFDTPGYENATNEYYGRYVWRRPVAAELDSVISTLSHAIYGYMWGPSEFTATGTLRTYDATPTLPAIAVPTLFTVGEFDESDPDIVRRQAARVPDAKFVVIPDAAHVTTWDAPEENVRVVREFLREVDRTRAQTR